MNRPYQARFVDPVVDLAIMAWATAFVVAAAPLMLRQEGLPRAIDEAIRTLKRPNLGQGLSARCGL